MRKTKTQHYSDEFKWKVVKEVLSGKYNKEEARRIYGISSNCAILYWMREYSGFSDYRKPDLPLQDVKTILPMKELSEQEKRIKELESELKREKYRADLWQKIVEIAEEEEGIQIRKKYGAKQSGKSKKKTNKK